MTSTQAGLVLQHLRRLAGPHPAELPPDAQLVERFTAQRDEAAFAALVRRHGPMVLNVCRGVLHHEQDAEDAFQATFLVLARKAASIRQPAAVAGWLCEVAYRVALRAQAGAVRRRAQERKVSPMPPADPTLDMTLRDLQRVLHEELRRLPEKYRLPLVLCYLEGRSQAEAAGQLGWSLGALRGRLDRGRDHLRRRLASRGVSLSALLCATAVVPRAAAATLVDSVVRAVGSSAVDGAAAGIVSARVRALAEAVSRAMIVRQFRVVSVVLLAVSLVAGGGALARQALATPEPPAVTQKSEPAAAKEAIKPRATDTADDRVVVHGCVVDPDGKPFPGAKVFFARFVLAHRDAPVPPPRAVTSDADGRFRLSISRTGYRPGDDFEKEHWLRGAIIAQGQGYGHGWVGADRVDKRTDVTVTLRKPVPIAGRVVDLQGRPIAGVSVRVLGVAFRQDGGDLKSYVEALQSRKTNVPGLVWMNLNSTFLGLTRPVVTGADGKFRLDGISGECQVSLLFAGPTIESALASALTRPAPTITGRRVKERPELGNFVCHGNTFDHVAAPTRPVVGVIRDRDMGQPLAGVTVRALLGSARAHFVNDPYVDTTTDAEGRYRLVGLAREGEHRLEVVPGRGQPYLPATKTLRAGSGLDPVTVDFALKRGVLIRGRVTDRQTGRPVPALVRYVAFTDNPYLKEASRLRDIDDIEVRTGADGSFTLLGLPGPGLLAAKAVGREQEGRYVTAAGVEEIKGPRWGEDHFDTQPQPCDPSEFNVLAAINPAKGAEAVVRDLMLDCGRTVTGTVVDPDGKPVTGANIDGVHGAWIHVKGLPTAEFRLTGVDPKHPRWYFIRHPGRNLGAVVLLRGDKPAPVVVRLQKCATITGRVVDDDGLPRSMFVFSVLETEELKGKSSFGVGGSPMQRTGKDGHFRIEGVMPGHPIGVYAGKTPSYVDPLVTDLRFKPGEVKDLGDVKVKPTQ